MSEKIINPISKNPHIKDINEYLDLYEKSIKDPESFFNNLAMNNLSWIKNFDSPHNNEFADAKWFEGGKINVSHNCIDRHLDKISEKVALIWQGDNPSESKKFTFQQLHTEVCIFSNVLKSLNVKKGSRVCIYMPMIPEAAFAMLALSLIHI
mgnify:FL=1